MDSPGSYSDSNNLYWLAGADLKLMDGAWTHSAQVQGVDAAMMFHPFDRDLLAHIALASVWIEMRYRGTPSHAALAPWEGLIARAG